MRSQAGGLAGHLFDYKSVYYLLLQQLCYRDTDLLLVYQRFVTHNDAELCKSLDPTLVSFPEGKLEKKA